MRSVRRGVVESMNEETMDALRDGRTTELSLRAEKYEQIIHL